MNLIFLEIIFCRGTIVPKKISLKMFLKTKIEFLIEMEYKPTPWILTFVSDMQEPDSYYFSN